MGPENLLHNLHLRTQKCTLGCPILDRCLGGGVPCNSVTELVAESGSGKTQFCLQLVLSAQLPPTLGGLAASSLYIHTEFPFPTRRLRQLSRSFRSSHPDLPDPIDRILVRGVNTADELVQLMTKIETLLVYSRSRLPVRVIIVDSIAALFRSEFENNRFDLRRRSSMFFKISGALRSFAKRFGVAVVVTNQVVDLISGATEGINGMRIGNLSELVASGRRVCAALGLAWANCVNSRLFLSREEEDVFDERGYKGSRTRRRISVVFAPHLGECSCEFVINREGVFGVEMEMEKGERNV